MEPKYGQLPNNVGSRHPTKIRTAFKYLLVVIKRLVNSMAEYTHCKCKVQVRFFVRGSK